MPVSSSPGSRSPLSRLPLSRAELDRDHRSRTGGIEAIVAEPATRAVVLHDGRVLLAGAASLALLDPADVPAHELALFLGRTTAHAPDAPAGSAVVAYVVGDEVASSLGGDWGELRRLGDRLSTRDTGLAVEALALLNWHRSYAFSPRSGRPTRVEDAGWVRRDPDTGAEFFPRTDAAIIVAVLDDDDRLLLGSNVLWEKNRFSLLAGFVEPGESLEAAVAREVEEESGIRVADPEYLGSQPWPFPASLMLGFRARVAPGAPVDPRPDGDEIVELRWFSRDELAASVGEVILPGPTSIARGIIEHWYGGELDDGSRE